MITFNDHIAIASNLSVFINMHLFFVLFCLPFIFQNSSFIYKRKVMDSWEY